MIPYANGISLAVSDSKTEYCIEFVQTYPDKQSESGVVSDSIARVIVNHDTATLLYNLLQKVLDPAFGE